MSAGVAPAPPPAVPLTGRELAIARSVMYASLFDYPLSLAQLRQTLVGSAQTPTEILEVYAHSVALQAAIDHQDRLFFPAGRQDLIAERRAREERSRAFLRRHRTMLTLACALPYVRMVALSGSVAHLNLEGSGDLDLFIITRPRRVWIVTVAVVLLAKLLRRRRTVCANFVLSDDRLVAGSAGSLHRQPDHPPEAARRHGCVRGVPRGEPVRVRALPQLSPDARANRRPPHSGAATRPEGDSRVDADRAVSGRGGPVPVGVSRVLAPPIRLLAIARTGPPGQRLRQAAHAKSPAIDPRSVRTGHSKP